MRAAPAHARETILQLLQVEAFAANSTALPTESSRSRKLCGRIPIADQAIT